MSDKPKCEFCRNPAIYRLGSGRDFLLCGVHLSVVIRRVGLHGLYRMSRAELRRRMGGDQ